MKYSVSIAILLIQQKPKLKSKIYYFQCDRQNKDHNQFKWNQTDFWKCATAVTAVDFCSLCCIRWFMSHNGTFW